MRLSPFEKIPSIGEVMAVPNSETWELEKLTVVDIVKDPTTARAMGTAECSHVFFSSPEPQDNVNISPNGQPFYTIRTYA